MGTSSALSHTHHVRNEKQYATFIIGHLLLGVEALIVQEVLRFHEMTCVPLAPDPVVGLINVRGQIVTAIDIRRKLELEPRDSELCPLNLIVRSEEGLVSLLIDDFGDVITISKLSCDPPPVNLTAGQRVLIDGVYQLDDKLLLILNADRILAFYRES